MAFWLWIMVTAWWWTTFQWAFFHLLHKPRVMDSFGDGHGDRYSSFHICEGPVSQWQHRHPPAQHYSYMPRALAALQGPPEPWKRETGRPVAPATHGPPAKAAWMCSEALPQLQSDFRHNSAFPSLANNFLISHQHIFMGNFNQKIQKNPEGRESTLQLFLHLMCCISCPSWLILFYLDTS